MSKAFKEVKEPIASAQVLAHYKPSLLIKVPGDASAYSIGAVISHVFKDGKE